MAKDPVPGILMALKANSAIAALVGTRVYGEELPRNLIVGDEEAGNDSIPQAIVVSSATGGFGLGQRSTIKVLPFRVDLKCYGETPYEARQVHYEVTSVLKRIIGKNFNGTRYYRFIPEIAAMYARDPDTDWPFVFSSYDVWASEFAVP